jgi:hypothetical protein
VATKKLHEFEDVGKDLRRGRHGTVRNYGKAGLHEDKKLKLTKKSGRKKINTRDPESWDSDEE